MKKKTPQPRIKKSSPNTSGISPLQNKELKIK
jgi:hypothetical protein